MKTIKPKDIPKEVKTKFKKSEVDYRKIRRELEPLITKRMTKKYSTIGEWKPSCCDY
jgi:hypothetical protein